jgi:hypothetical protein
MNPRERNAVLEGAQSGGSLCLVICVGRSYSPQDGGKPIGTWSVGIGAQAGFSYIPSVSFVPASGTVNLSEIMRDNKKFQ